jgi:hypothetical protein
MPYEHPHGSIFALRLCSALARTPRGLGGTYPMSFGLIPTLHFDGIFAGVVPILSSDIYLTAAL